MKDKGLFFLILSFVCFWLVLDQVFGNKLIEQFVGNILPSTSKSGGVLQQTYEAELQNNTSSTDKDKDGDIDTDDLRKDEDGNYTGTTAGNMAGYKG